MLADLQLTHPDTDHARSDNVDGVLAFADTQTGERRAAAIECKYYATPTNPLAVTGQQFAALEQERFTLASFLRSQRWTLKATLEQFRLADLASRRGPEPREGSAEYLREIRKKLAEQFNAYLRALYALTRVTRCLSLVRKIFFVEFRPFRGFDWSKRAWSLLHGSHPPKMAAQTAVLGCA